jgi:hypothetical protein
VITKQEIRQAMEIDSAYIEGARQALRIAEQSMDAAREWVRGGCGVRAAEVLQARRDLALSAEAQQEAK